jgi:hypothetical protein
MTGVAILIDNDVVIKLAQMDAYADALSALGVKPKEVGSAPHMLDYMGRKLARITRSQEEADRLQQILLSITEITITAEESALSAQMMKTILQAQLDMEEGEVLLMSVAIKRPETTLATGDKRALRGLPTLAETVPILATLKGRIICFEQIIRKLCEKHGFPRIRIAVLTARHADGTITMAYDELQSGGAKQFMAALNFLVQNQLPTVAPNWLRSL